MRYCLNFLFFVTLKFAFGDSVIPTADPRCFNACDTTNCNSECIGHEGVASCNATFCQSTTKGDKSKAVCVGGQCFSTCYDRQCTAKCLGEVCQSKCEGSDCTSYCNGGVCNSQCDEDFCKAFCEAGACMATSNGDMSMAMCRGESCKVNCLGLGCIAKCKGDNCISTCIGRTCVSECFGVRCQKRYLVEIITSGTSQPDDGNNEDENDIFTNNHTFNGEQEISVGLDPKPDSKLPKKLLSGLHHKMPTALVDAKKISKTHLDGSLQHKYTYNNKKPSGGYNDSDEPMFTINFEMDY